MSSGRCLWRKSQRILRPAHFAALVATRPSWQSSKQWLAVTAYLVPATQSPNSSATHLAPPQLAPVLVGFAVPKRFSKRAVMRNLVKRMLRESARHITPSIQTVLPQGYRLDVVFKLRAALPRGTDLSLPQLQTQTRALADGLWLGVEQWLRKGGQTRVLRAPHGVKSSAEPAAMAQCEPGLVPPKAVS